MIKLTRMHSRGNMSDIWINPLAIVAMYANFDTTKGGTLVDLHGGGTIGEKKNITVAEAPETIMQYLEEQQT